MELKEAKQLALDLMEKHKLPWNFIFDEARSRFGQCDYSTQTISLSKYLVELNAPERVKSTILHEIAHALLPAGEGHSKVWKRKAIELGDDGERCYSAEDTVIPKPAHTYVYRCINCGNEIQKNYKMHQTQACRKCCLQFNNGQYSAKFAFRYSRELKSEVDTVSSR